MNEYPWQVAFEDQLAYARLKQRIETEIDRLWPPEEQEQLHPALRPHTYRARLLAALNAEDTL